MLEDDVAQLQSEGTALSLLEIAQQLTGFESRVSRSLSAITHKLDALENPARAEASAAAAPVEATQGPPELRRPRQQR
jgi:hypothetical protein